MVDGVVARRTSFMLDKDDNWTVMCDCIAAKKTMLTEAIRTERLLLRPFKESDYDDLRHDPEEQYTAIVNGGM